MDKNKLITIEKLSELSNIKIEKIVGYIRKGFLSFEKEEENGKRYYNKKDSIQCLRSIQGLENEGHTDKEIKNRFSMIGIFKKIKELEE